MCKNDSLLMSLCNYSHMLVKLHKMAHWSCLHLVTYSLYTDCASVCIQSHSLTKGTDLHVGLLLADEYLSSFLLLLSCIKSTAE